MVVVEQCEQFRCYQCIRAKVVRIAARPKNPGCLEFWIEFFTRKVLYLTAQDRVRLEEESVMELPLPSPTHYDQAARYLLRQAGALLFYWLLHLTAAQVRFARWLP